MAERARVPIVITVRRNDFGFEVGVLGWLAEKPEPLPTKAKAFRLAGEMQRITGAHLLVSIARTAGAAR